VGCRAASVRRGRSCPTLDTAVSSRPTAGHNRAPRPTQQYLCESVFKKEQKSEKQWREHQGQKKEEVLFPGRGAGIACGL